MATQVDSLDVVNLLKKRLKQLGNVQVGNCEVGYLAPYSTYVHEDVTKYHPVGKDHFLSDPLHRDQRKIINVIATSLNQGKTLSQALLDAGNYLKARSILETPVDTGFLVKSAYVVLV